MHINNCFILSNFLNYVSNIISINCHIAVMIRDVCSHGSPLTQRVTHDGKNQISGNQRVSVGRTASPGGPNTDHLLFRFALNLETESAVRPRRRRPAIGDGWVSPLTVLSIHALAPFPQLNNCIHIHPPVLPVRSRLGSPSSPFDRRFFVPLSLIVLVCFSRRSYRSVGRTTDSSPEDFASKQFTIKLHAESPPRSCARELQNGGYVMSDQK